jgi:hypothetical protein
LVGLIPQVLRLALALVPVRPGDCFVLIEVTIVVDLLLLFEDVLEGGGLLLRSFLVTGEESRQCGFVHPYVLGAGNIVFGGL